MEVNIIKMKKIFRILSVVFISAILFAISANQNLVKADSHIAGGDFFQAFNNTTQEGTWRDPVSAAPGQIVEFMVTIKNDGDQPTGDMQVWGSVTGQVPQDPAQQQVVTAKIHNPNTGQTLTDTATVNITGNVPVGMRYLSGHARIQGVTDLYPNCANACPLTDDVLGGIFIGVIQPGDFVQVAFKATLVNPPSLTPTATPTQSPSATPTPTATPTGVPTATPTGVPSATPTGIHNITTNITCPNGNTITVNAGSNADVNALCNIVNSTNVNNNNNNNSNPININLSNVGGAGITTTPAPVQQTNTVSQVSELPRTGLPLAAWAFSGLLPVGLGLKKFGKQVSDTATNTPNYLWQMRQFLKKD